ncbi:MAG: VTT domain-containing protein [Verrucomicrobiales bacterium]|nr:VTT domain-containing protein [Verrucomicrobiales bacterium]
MKAALFLKRHWGGLVVVLLLVGGLVFLWKTQEGRLDRESILAYGMSLPPVVIVIAFFLLPLIGFPVSVLLVLIGLRFGVGWGMVLVTVGMLFHHLVVFAISRSWLREKMERRIASFGHRIPRIEERHRFWFTTIFASIHGPPYAAKLYLLALTNLPFRYYCGIGVPVYAGFSLIPVGAGKAITDLNAMTVGLILLGTVALFFLAHWLKRRYSTGVAPSDGTRSAKTGNHGQ